MDWSPLWISLRVAGWSTFLAVVFGLALAYPLARSRNNVREIAEGIVNLPLVMPPTVLGYALLVALGRRSPLNAVWMALAGHPLDLVFTWRGAVVAATVASLPLFVSHARVALSAIDGDVIDAARTDGAGRFALYVRILFPLSLPGILAGTALAFARALGDFGATLMVAGDTPGLTRTMSLAIYDAVSNGDDRTVRTFAVITCILSLTVSLIASRLTPRR